MSTTSENFLTYSRTIVRILKYTGFACFSIDNDYNPTLKLANYILVLVNCSLGLFLIGDSFENLDFASDENVLINVGSVFAAYTAAIITLITIAFYFVRFNGIWDLTKSFHVVDLKFSSLGLAISHAYILKFYMIVGAVSCLPLIPIITLMYYYGETVTDIVLFVYTGIYYSLAMGGIASCLLCIDIRLKNISDVLQMNFNFDGMRSGKSFPDSSKSKVLAILNEAYNDLNSAMGETSGIFGFSAMLGVFSCYLFSIHTSFVAYKALISDEYDAKAMITILWWIYLSVFPVIIVAYCEIIGNHADEIAKYLKEILKHSKDEIQCLKVLSFANLVKSSPFKLTCGLFDFDVDNAFAGVASAFSYFVILIQFDMAAESSVEEA